MNKKRQKVVTSATVSVDSLIASGLVVIGITQTSKREPELEFVKEGQILSEKKGNDGRPKYHEENMHIVGYPTYSPLFKKAGGKTEHLTDHPWKIAEKYNLGEEILKGLKNSDTRTEIRDKAERVIGRLILNSKRIYRHQAVNEMAEFITNKLANTTVEKTKPVVAEFSI